MHRLSAFIVSLCLGFAFAPASASEIRFQRDNVVVVYTEEAGCGLALSSVIVERGEANLLLLYHAKEKRVHFSLSSQVTTSLPQKGTADLDLVMILDDQFDEAWGKLPFVYFEADGVWSFNRFFTGVAAGQILDDLSKATYVALQHNDDPFTGAKLDNSALAIAELRKCAFEKAGLHLKDPFAQ